MTRLPVAVVGVGHLGKEHARILASMSDVHLVAVVDPNRSQAEGVATRCNTRAVTNHQEVIGDIKAAVIAAPTAHHHTVAADLLRRGIPVLIEKPLASSALQARDLVRLASTSRTTIQVGHIERFNPAFEELKGRSIVPRYVQCERYSGFSGRSTDVGVVLDMMIHDIDLLLDLIGAPVTQVEAMGAALLGGHEDMVQARVRFANGSIADLTASRVHPEPLRRMRLWGVEGQVTVDFARKTLHLMQPSEHLRSRRIDSRRLDLATAGSLKTELFTRYIHSDEVDCSEYHKKDQLTRELDDFLHCVRTGETPRVSGEAGAAALELADRILASVAEHAWQGASSGLPPCGPNQLPAANGLLFPLPQADAPAREAA